jgi:hypothetical protein
MDGLMNNIIGKDVEGSSRGRLLGDSHHSPTGAEENH